MVPDRPGHGHRRRRQVTTVAPTLRPKTTGRLPAPTTTAVATHRDEDGRPAVATAVAAAAEQEEKEDWLLIILLFALIAVVGGGVGWWWSRRRRGDTAG